MRPKANSATKRFLFDHVWGIPYQPGPHHVCTPSVATESNQMNVLYLREKEGEEPRLCGSSALGSAVSGSSLPGLQWMVRGEGELQRKVWGVSLVVVLILSLTLCVASSLLSLTGKKQG